MNYPGYCVKYGSWVPGTAQLLSSALGMTAGGIAGAFNHAAVAGVTSGGLCGLIFGVIGLARVYSAHEQKNKELSAEGVGITRGGEIIRRTQRHKFFGPVLLGMAFSAGVGALSSLDLETHPHKAADNAAEKKTKQPAPKIPEKLPTVS
jgi:hypothetical protein